jgi:TIR domain
MSRIIISYRRADSAAIAGRIFDRLSSHYGDESVFMDIDKIPFGTDFREHIRKVLLDGDILLAVIGPNWLGKTADGGSRISDDADPVRVEIETALRQKTTVIPILVDGAAMPSSAELPESMRDLAYINAAPLDVGRDFRQHMDRLIRSIDTLLGEDSEPAPTAARNAAPSASPARLRVGLAVGAAAIVLVAAAGWAFTPQHWFAAAPPPERSPVNAASPVSQPDVSKTAQPDLSKLVPPDFSAVQPSNAAQRDVKNAAAPVRAEPERLRRRAEPARRPRRQVSAGGRDPRGRNRHHDRRLPRVRGRHQALVRCQVEDLLRVDFELLHRGRADRGAASHRLNARELPHER